MDTAQRIQLPKSFARIPTEGLAWLWLAVGSALLPFTAWQIVSAVAAWIAPVFLLRFARTVRRPWLAQRLLFLVSVGSAMIAMRGMPFNALGFLGNVLLKGSAWSLPYALDRRLGRHLHGWARTLLFPMAYVVVELMLSLSPLTSSGSPAYSQAGNLPLLQLLSITGTSGITFLIMWCASIANELWGNGFWLKPCRGVLVVYASVLVAAFAFGAVRLVFAAPSAETVPAASVTVDQEISAGATAAIDWAARNWSTEEQRRILRTRLAPTVDQALTRTETSLRRGAKLVGWQESGAWILEEDEPGLVERAGALAREYDAYLLLALEVITRGSDLRVLRNESIMVDAGGTVRWIYDKAHPVPYDEAFATIAGPGRLPLVDTPYGRVSTAICYDTYYPGLVRQAGAGGADVFFGPANDSRPLAESAALMASYRAIENGFSLLRPAGHGLSALIDYQGRFVARRDYFTDDTGVMVANLPIRGVRTIYSRIGDAFAYLCGAGLIGLVGVVVVQKRRVATHVRIQRQPA